MRNVECVCVGFIPGGHERHAEVNLCDVIQTPSAPRVFESARFIRRRMCAKREYNGRISHELAFVSYSVEERWIVGHSVCA